MEVVKSQVFKVVSKHMYSLLSNMFFFFTPNTEYEYLLSITIVHLDLKLSINCPTYLFHFSQFYQKYREGSFIGRNQMNAAGLGQNMGIELKDCSQ